jgi:hypothetical protein
MGSKFIKVITTIIQLAASRQIMQGIHSKLSFIFHIKHNYVKATSSLQLNAETYNNLDKYILHSQWIIWQIKSRFHPLTLLPRLSQFHMKKEVKKKKKKKKKKKERFT